MIVCGVGRVVYCWNKELEGEQNRIDNVKMNRDEFEDSDWQ